MRSLCVYGEHTGPGQDLHPVNNDVDPEMATQTAINDITACVDKDTQPLRILARVDKRTAERLAVAAIARMVVDPDPTVKEDGLKLQKALKQGQALGGVAVFFKRMSQSELESRKFSAIVLGLLDQFLLDNKKSPQNFTVTSGYGWASINTTVNIATTKISPARAASEEYAKQRFERFSQRDIASGQIFSLIEMKQKTTWCDPTKENHPVELVLQVLDQDPKPVKIGGYYHGLIDIRGSNGNPTVVTKFNTRFDHEDFKHLLKAKSRAFLKGPKGNDGLLNGYDEALRKALEALPPEEVETGEEI